MKIKLLILLMLTFTGFHASAQKTTYQLQREFAEWRFGMFMHLEMGTYTDDDGWGDKEFTDPKVFNPDKLDCNQWADAAKAAGMTFAILTTRHHYGFSLWPTHYYDDYNVSHSPYKRDILKQYVTAFRAKGIKPCFYYSMWDRHHKVEKGSVSAEDLNYIKGQLTELLTNYGEIPMLIIDGWSWQMGHREIPYAAIRALVKKLQPNCILIDHNGLTEIWEGDAIYFEEPMHIWSPETNQYASCQGMTITNGWFWHTGTSAATPLSVSAIVDDHIKKLEKRYSNFILNCPINRYGLLDSAIVQRLKEVGQSWKPDLGRPPLPLQMQVLEHPLTPLRALASSGNADLAIDGKCNTNGKDRPIQTLWETAPGDTKTYITLDMGSVYTGIDMLTYLPRQYGGGEKNTQGNITRYSIYYSTDNIHFKKAAKGTWQKTKTFKQAIFKQVKARYIRLKSDTPDDKMATASEIACGSYKKQPRKA